MLVVLSHKRDSGGTKEQWQGLGFSEFCFKTTMSQIFISLTRPPCCNFSSPDSMWSCANPDAFLKWWVLQPPPGSSRCHAPPLRAQYYKPSVGWLWLCHVLQTSSAGCSFGIGLYLFPACSAAWMSGHSCACLLCYHDFPFFLFITTTGWMMNCVLTFHIQL